MSRQQRTIAHSKPLRNPGSVVNGRRRGWNVDHVYKNRGLKSMIVICGHVLGWSHFPCVGMWVMWLIRPHTSPRGAGWSPTWKKSLVFLCGCIWGASDGHAGRHPGTWLVQIFNAAVRWISAQRNRNRSFLLIRRFGGIMGRKLITKAAAIGRPMG